MPYALVFHWHLPHYIKPSRPECFNHASIQKDGTKKPEGNANWTGRLFKMSFETTLEW